MSNMCLQTEHLSKAAAYAGTSLKKSHRLYHQVRIGTVWTAASGNLKAVVTTRHSARQAAATASPLLCNLKQTGGIGFAMSWRELFPCSHE